MLVWKSRVVTASGFDTWSWSWCSLSLGRGSISVRIGRLNALNRESWEYILILEEPSEGIVSSDEVYIPGLIQSQLEVGPASLFHGVMSSYSNTTG